MPRCRTFGKCVLVTAMGYGSTSLAHTGVAPHITAERGIVPLPSNRLPSFTVSAGRCSSALIWATARLTKNRALGSAIPLPHILYSAPSVCSWLCHLARALSLVSIDFFGTTPLIVQAVRYTPRQKSAVSGGISAGRCSISPQPSGNPCRRLHSKGIRRRTM